MSEQLTWVVGASGLLGSAVTRMLAAAGQPAWQAPRPVPWGRGSAADEALRANAWDFAQQCSSRDWAVLWCAGAAVTSSSPAALDAEVDAFAALLDALGDNRQRGAGAGTVFVASSAGGVYAGSTSPPFNEHSDTRALSAYGHAKLRMESLVASWASSTGGRAATGRLANIYGPGQDMTKPQGLISALLRASLLRAPLQVYVPLDTIRDYVFVDDAAQSVVAIASRARHLSAGTNVIKVVASQRPQTIAAVLGEVGRITSRRPLVVLGSSPSARFQARDLRLRSSVWPEIDSGCLTTLAAGMHTTFLSMQRQLGRGRLA